MNRDASNGNYLRSRHDILGNDYQISVIKSSAMSELHCGPKFLGPNSVLYGGLELS